jgi:hypothetical protein
MGIHQKALGVSFENARRQYDLLSSYKEIRKDEMLINFLRIPEDSPISLEEPALTIYRNVAISKERETKEKGKWLAVERYTNLFINDLFHDMGFHINPLIL